MQDITQEPRFSLAQVRARGLTAIGDDVFDLRAFAARHPGGDFLCALRGKDATKQLLLAHGNNPAVRRALQRLRVGALEASSRPPEDRHLLALEAELRADGWFQPRRTWLARDLLGILAPFALAICCGRACAPLAFVLLCIALLNQTYLAHDARHQSVLADERGARRLVDLLGALVLGTTLNPLADEHRRHHAFTNCLAQDDALNTAGLVWHRRQWRGQGRRRLRLQAAWWLLAVLPCTYPYMLCAGLRYLARRRQHLLLLAIVGRWLLLGLWWRSAWLLLAPPLLIAALQALIASLNHFHLDIAPAAEPSFARTMILRSQNTNPGPLWTWLCGALNFHIEHHLFPDMPRRNYPRVAARVAQFCAEHGLPYQRCSRAAALAQLLRKLRRPFGAQRRRTAPSAVTCAPAKRCGAVGP